MEQNGSLDTYARQTAEALESVDTSQIGSEVDLTLQQIITEDSEVVGDYHLILAPGSATVHQGRAHAPDITIRQDATTAEAIRNGTLHAQGAFLTGRLSVDGNVDKLLEHSELLGALLSGSPRA